MPRTATTTCPVPSPVALTSPGSRWRVAGHVVVALALAWFALLWLGWSPVWPAVSAAVAVGVFVVALVVWRLCWPRGFARCAAAPVLGRYWRRRIRRDWPETAHHCGLTHHDHLPRILRAGSDWPRITLRVRPTKGQTTTDFETAAEALRVATGSSQIRVEPYGVRDILLVFTIGDALSKPFDAVTPESSAPSPDVPIASVPMGRRSDGETWHMAVGPHTLVAGASGSGKGSLFWSFAFALAPQAAQGRVQLHGIDLKGGMEILMGESLFTSRATSAAEAVVLLEQMVAWMRQRTIAYAGRVRTHLPTTDEPLHVVMIDELAALTAYCADRELQRRAETALNLLCSQGRAPGFMVFACLQDPRKEVIPSRGLFTQMVGLRLKDASETTMVLGETAAQAGAHCHRIPRTMPGTGYVIPDEGGHPIRVRAGFASDERIREVARRFPAPAHNPVDATALEEELAARQNRRARSTGPSGPLGGTGGTP